MSMPQRNRARTRDDDRVTTRTLVLLRHAKSAHPEGVADIDRPLTPRGHADAAAAGAWLMQRGYPPDLVLCSPSRRTRETWHGIALAFTAGPTVRYDERAYDASAENLLDLIRDTEDDVTTIMLVGHNPAMSHLSSLLDPTAADPEGLRTCGLAVHALTGSWVDCGPKRAALTASHTARA
jgi:phosphohistidine phosphatase